MHTVITIIIGVLLFSGIIVFHEFGHFIVAKKNGIKVEEFMIGLGPKIFSFKKGETVFAFRLFLIGGACQMLGEDAVCEDERAFCNKGPWARFATVFAGPLFNFILEIILNMGVKDLCNVTEEQFGKDEFELDKENENFDN